MEVEYTAPELLPLWLRHGHQVPEDLTRDLQSGGVSHSYKLQVHTGARRMSLL